MELLELLIELPSQSCVVSFALWDHTVLSAIRHKWTHPTLTPAGQAAFQFIYLCPCGARGRCRIIPPHFLAECRKMRLNQGSFVSAVCLVVCFLWFVLCLCVYFCDLHEFFFLIVFLSVTVKWLAVKTASEMTYTVLGGALNSTQSNLPGRDRRVSWPRWLITCWDGLPTHRWSPIQVLARLSTARSWTRNWLITSPTLWPLHY